MVSEGNNVKDSCAMCGVQEGTYYNWISIANDLTKEASDERRALCTKLRDEMEVARAKNKDFHIQNINRAAKSGSWQASAWYLERVYHKEYARTDKLEHSGSDGKPIQINILGVKAKD